MSKIIIKVLSLLFSSFRNLYVEREELKDSIKSLSDENLKLICNIKELESIINDKDDTINRLKQHIENKPLVSNENNDGVVNEKENDIVIDNLNSLF